MANKKIKVYYYYATTKEENNRGVEILKVKNLKEILESLNQKEKENRTIILNEEENLQLKTINKNDLFGYWELGFLKNSKDSVFKTKLDDDTTEAEKLDEDEYLGQECCMLFDEVTNIISLQHNRSSASHRAISDFFGIFSNNENINLIPITYKKEYNEISDREDINYRNINISFVNINEINRLAKSDDKEAVKRLSAISENFGEVSGNIQLSVGRGKGLKLDKGPLKQIVNFFKKYPSQARGLKVKMQDADTIKIIDLIENKLLSEFDIPVSKDDTKNFNKILGPMKSSLEIVIDEELEHCIKLTDEVYA